MRIVDYNTFIKLPEGTMYCEYSPCVFGDLKIKDETISNSDWFYSSLQSNPEFDSDFYGEACEPMKKGEDINPDFNCIERDGMFDYDRQFLIYNKGDVQAMINKLQSIL